MIWSIRIIMIHGGLRMDDHFFTLEIIAAATTATYMAVDDEDHDHDSCRASEGNFFTLESSNCDNISINSNIRNDNGDDDDNDEDEDAESSVSLVRRSRSSCYHFAL
jgi:hypothetical protein